MNESAPEPTKPTVVRLKDKELVDQICARARNVILNNLRERGIDAVRIRYQPGGCATPKRFGAVRHRADEEMFWRHAFLTAHEQDGPAQLAFEHHRLKGDKERLLSELLGD